MSTFAGIRSHIQIMKNFFIRLIGSVRGALCIFKRLPSPREPQPWDWREEWEMMEMMANPELTVEEASAAVDRRLKTDPDFYRREIRRAWTTTIAAPPR